MGRLDALRPTKSAVSRLGILFVIPLAGALRSFETGDWDWFARSGSVMVAASIMLFAMVKSLSLTSLQAGSKMAPVGVMVFTNL